MKKIRTKAVAGLLCLMLLVSELMGGALCVRAQEMETEQGKLQGTKERSESVVAGSGAVDIAAPSAILMEASTGGVIWQRDSEVRRSPASITKIMTLILIFEELDAGRIKLADEVTTSAYAKSMGGSQVFLEEGEQQTVDTLIKCITVASGNDACVAMAEYIAGSEEEFVARMNQKAKELGMTDTHFEDCCGLTSSDGHYTTAKDVAVMSRELIVRHPAIYEYTKIWMEDITHTTKRGSTPFTLSSTNKLLKQYPYTTGLKTGSTNKAKYCLSATANKDGIDLIAVVMAAPDYKIRFQDAMKLLNYGFAVSRLYTDENKDVLPEIAVSGGVAEKAPVAYKEAFSYLDLAGNDVSQIQKELRLPESVEAPVREGDIAGKAVYMLNGKELGSVELVFTASVEKAAYRDYLRKVFGFFF